MAENIPPQISGDTYKREARYPACDPPQKIVGSNQSHEKCECQPYAIVGRPGGESIDEIFDAVLCAHGASNGCSNSSHNRDVRRRSLAEITQHESERTMSVSRETVHRTPYLPLRSAEKTNLCKESRFSIAVNVPKTPIVLPSLCKISPSSVLET
jgi:hypothetical protein